MKRIKKTFLVLFISFLVLFLSACNNTYYNKFFLINAFRNAENTVEIFTNRKISNKKRLELEEEMNTILDDLDKLFNIQGVNPQSQLMDINNNSGIKAVEVSQEVIYVLQEALKMSELSKVDDVALFDPTIAPVWKAWDFPRNTYDYFDNKLRESEIDAIKENVTELINAKLVDYNKVVIDEEQSTVFLEEEGMALDLGGIVKGYAADKLKIYLLDKGYDSAIINIGGNIQLVGSIFGKPFSVGIRTPYVNWSNFRYDEDDNIINNVYGTVQVNDQTVVTSGTYEKFIQDEEGNRYHHILDPRTGLPFDNNVIAITVITNQSIVADGLSTSLFALGLERGMEIVNATEGLETIWVIKNGRQREIYLSKGLEDLFTFNENVTKERFIFKGVYYEDTED
jgi:thiamine biosynthesis lipoprotein